MELIFVGLAVFFLAGVASMWQAFKNARTSTDKETGTWFMIGLLMAAFSISIFLVLLD